jgi:hypothetical protein
MPYHAEGCVSWITATPPEKMARGASISAVSEMHGPSAGPALG